MAAESAAFYYGRLVGRLNELHAGNAESVLGAWRALLTKCSTRATPSAAVAASETLRARRAPSATLNCVYFAM